MNDQFPHRCNCSSVTRCQIFVHPSSKVQTALNTLMDAMAEFDEETQSNSTLIFHSEHSTGLFSSVTSQAIPIGCVEQYKKLWPERSYNDAFYTRLTADGIEKDSVEASTTQKDGDDDISLTTDRSGS